MAGLQHAPPISPLCVLLTRAPGHSLLKKKADALNMRFRQILKKIVETKEEMGKVMKASFFSLAQVGAAFPRMQGPGADGQAALVQACAASCSPLFT